MIMTVIAAFIGATLICAMVVYPLALMSARTRVDKFSMKLRKKGLSAETAYKNALEFVRLSAFGRLGTLGWPKSK